jgi:hypothetical protein
MCSGGVCTIFCGRRCLCFNNKVCQLKSTIIVILRFIVQYKGTKIGKHITNQKDILTSLKFSLKQENKKSVKN